MRDNAATYTLTTPGGTVTFQPGTKLFFRNVEWSAAIREMVGPRALRHGGYRDPSYKDRGTFIGDAWYLTNGLSAATVEADRTALVKALNSILDGGGTLGWTNYGGGTALELTDVALLTDPQFAIADYGWVVQVALSSDKPFAEDATATQVDSIPLTEQGSGFDIPLTIPFTIVASGGGSLQVTHSGDFPEAYPLLRIYGPITNPNIVNQTTANRLAFTGSIAAGDYWEVDLFDRTVKLNGQTTIRAVDTDMSTWWSVGLGTSTLQLSGSGYDANTFLRAYMRSTWA